MDLDAIVTRTFAAAEANDWATFRAAFAADAVLRQNVGRAQPIDAAMVSLPRLTADGTTLRYENVCRVVAERAVTEMHDAVFTKPDGSVVRIDICVVFEFNADGLIVRAHEYLDSAAAEPLFASRDSLAIALAGVRRVQGG